MRKKEGFLGRFGERLDIPREALPGGFGLTLSGQSELTVRGCRRILEYSTDLILLLLSGVVLEISGEGLLCRVFTPERITVCGRVSAICFKEAKGYVG